MDSSSPDNIITNNNNANSNISVATKEKYIPRRVLIQVEKLAKGVLGINYKLAPNYYEICQKFLPTALLYDEKLTTLMNDIKKSTPTFEAGNSKKKLDPMNSLDDLAALMRQKPTKRDVNKNKYVKLDAPKKPLKRKRTTDDKVEVLQEKMAELQEQLAAQNALKKRKN